MREYPSDALETRLAARLATLRAEQGLSLDALAERTGISRATLSRLERGEASPTAAMLGRLCTAYGRTLSRLMTEVEDAAPALIPAAAQPCWTDPGSGFRRRIVSPPGGGLRAELLEGTMPPGATLAYDTAPQPGLEHHLWLLDGALELTVDGETHRLSPGDCLRYRLFGPSRFHCPAGSAAARYVLALCPP
ncbi:helix-turn-helix domain-containing protein [Teichococcus vastitatis]|uniref:XRE family transcriptional regulator n=1 Tax=Teichococcus vastitatis TaxID=2307076 RepID=A0ABS9WC60_9PROT|nr:XRE family transcriptional regulator [Pseudoroseomonas vastitatis]MCI0756578.1 XRE family transcriptional regulator [Pseudoroseomonas vastitatis]